MPSEVSELYDTLSGIPHNLFQFTRSFADTLEDYSDAAALRLRVTLSSSSWIPEEFRPAPPAPPRAERFFCDPSLQSTWLSRTVSLVCDHAAVSAAIVAFVGTGTWLVWRQRRAYARKRRVKRGPRGQRTEAVVVVATQESDIVRSLILDLERRGFVVFVAGTAAELYAAKGSRTEILPLHLNVADPVDVETTIRQFNDLLTTEDHNFQGTSQSVTRFKLAGVVIIPDLSYPVGPAETISPELWSDSLNAKVLHTIATTQAFLRTLSTHKARLLMLTPTVVPSLRPPYHSVESTVVGALDNFTLTLRYELAPLGVPVCQLKLGTFDALSRNTADGNPSRQALQQAPASVVRGWDGYAQTVYGHNFLEAEDDARDTGAWSRRFRSMGRSSRGSPLRELNNAVFDALTVPSPSAVWRVGKGSLIYPLVGTLVPPGLVGWILGLQRVDPLKDNEAKGLGTGSSMWEKVERMV